MDGGGASDQAASYLATVLSEVERLLDAGDREGAIAVLEDNLRQAQSALAYEPLGVLYAALGDVHQRAGEIEPALAAYEKAAAALHEAGNGSSEAGALLRCGDAQRALRRTGAASQSYATAAALYGMLGDARGAGHAEYLLAELAAGVNREIAETHYRQAIEFYLEAAEREGDPVSSVGLPDHIADPRQIESARMVEAAKRGLARLALLPAVPEAPPPGEWTPPPPVVAADGEPQPPPAPAPSPPEPRLSAISTWPQLPLAILGIGICGLILLALRWSEEAPLLSVAGVIIAGGIAVLVARRAHTLSPYLGYVAAGVAWILLLVSGARPILRQTQPAAAPAPPPAPTVAADVQVPWTPEGQRRQFEIEVAENDGDARQQAEVLRRYGEFECSQGDNARCVALWAQSRERYRDAAAPAKAAEVSLAMGRVHMRGGRPEPARQHFDLAVALYGEARDAGGLSLALRRRGEAEVALQRWAAATASYNEGLRWARQAHNVQSETMLILRCAAIEQAQGRVDRARALLYQALRLSDAIGPLHARVWLALADFEAAADQDAAALRAYERAATLAGAERDADLEARGMRHRARYESRRGQLASARGRYEVGIRLAHAREATLAEGLNYLGAAALEAEAGDVLAARANYASAEALFAQLPRSAGAVRVALGLGDLAAGMGDVETAQTEYTRALHLAADADRTDLQIRALDRLSTLLADRDPETSTTYAERASSLRADAFGVG
jgi:tetratricopeptide (TPR) repeat protein